MVSHTRTISTLDVRNNDFGVKGALEFAVGLADNISLTNLDLSHNRLTGEPPFDDVGGIVALAESLGTSHSALAFLGLSYNHIANEKSTGGCVALGGVIIAITTVPFCSETDARSVPVQAGEARDARRECHGALRHDGRGTHRWER